jgi:RNA recognition motif-containing protein
MNRMNIYVGNIPFAASQDQVKELFAQFGQVESVRIIMDKLTGRSRVFAFVQFASREEGQQAIDNLNNKDFLGKQLRVNEARPREEGAAPRRSNGNGNGGSNGSFNRRSRY